MTTSGIILAALLAVFSQNSEDAGHGGVLNAPCVECHPRLPFSGRTLSLRNSISDACRACHRLHMQGMQFHPMDIVPSMRVPSDMLLDHQGRIVCVSCHAFHGEYRDEDGNKRYYLRRTRGKGLCYSCHKSLPR